MKNFTTKHQRLAALRQLSPESVASLADAWDVLMVYESCSIEGNSLTMGETKDVLEDLNSTKASGKPLQDYTDVHDLGRAWDYVKEHASKNAELTELILRRICKILTGKSHSVLEGAFTSSFKNIASAMGGTCSEPEYWSGLFEDLPVDPLEKAARIHYRIIRSSYFGSGKGRTARLAMNFILLAAGYPPISIPTDLRQDYYNSLEAADSGDFSTWQNFLTTQLHHELDLWLDALAESQEQKL